jgi:phospholipid/cholesterol/gamma-HCH transport system ATP-binding protein
MIELQDVWMDYGGPPVLKGVSFRCAAKRVTAVVGPSGSGKSSVLRLLMGLAQISRGSVRIGGQSIAGLSERQWRHVRRRMGMVFQNSALFDSLTVLENVGFYPFYVERQPWRKVAAAALELLEELGLSEAANRLPEELSGGMQRRVALARALIYKPEILLYDEPTTGLDPANTEIVNELIREMNEKYGVTSVVVTHDLQCVQDVADEVVLIDAGESLVIGGPADMLTSADPRVAAFTASWRAHFHGLGGR